MVSTPSTSSRTTVLSGSLDRRRALRISSSTVCLDMRRASNTSGGTRHSRTSSTTQLWQLLRSPHVRTGTAAQHHGSIVTLSLIHFQTTICAVARTHRADAAFLSWAPPCIAGPALKPRAERSTRLGSVTSEAPRTSMCSMTRIGENDDTWHRRPTFQKSRHDQYMCRR